MYAERLQLTLPQTRDAIAHAAERAGRRPEDVRLVAVTKGHPLEALEAALEAGLQDLGENRVAELREKAEALAGRDVRWHMIGHVQSRKAKDLVGVADLVHSVDRPSLLDKLSRAATERDMEVAVLFQVNTSGEDAKGGFDLAEAEDALLAAVETPGLRAEGLMTMAPFVDDERILRATFSRLRELAQRVRALTPRLGPELSMGMSNDLAIAVEEGSTMVRIGTALFGPRPQTVSP